MGLRTPHLLTEKSRVSEGQTAPSFETLHPNALKSESGLDWTQKENLPGASCGAKRSQCAVAAFQWKMPRKLVGPRP